MKINRSIRISIVFTLFILFSMFLASCAMPGAAPEATTTPTITKTSTPAPTATITLTPTVTATATATSTSTPLPNLTATQISSDFADTLQELYDAKYVTTKDGTYLHLSDFKKDVAKINYLKWYETGQSPTNFVLRSDITWDSASAAANDSGCGFFFHITGNDKFYIFYVSLKGTVQMSGYNSGVWSELGTGTYGSAKQKGGVNLTLIAQDTTYKVLINDKLIKTYTGSIGKLLHGELAYTVLSGTNKSFGTRCTFTNTVLWTLP
jgi:hypothetical protein